MLKTECKHGVPLQGRPAEEVCGFCDADAHPDKMSEGGVSEWGSEPAYFSSSSLSHKWAKSQVQKRGLFSLVGDYIQICGNSHDLSNSPVAWWVKPRRLAKVFVFVGHYGNLENPDFFVVPKDKFGIIARLIPYFDEDTFKVCLDDLKEYKMEV